MLEVSIKKLLPEDGRNQRCANHEENFEGELFELFIPAGTLSSTFRVCDRCLKAFEKVISFGLHTEKGVGVECKQAIPTKLNGRVDFDLSYTTKRK